MEVGGKVWAAAFVAAVLGRSEASVASMRRAAARAAATAHGGDVVAISWEHLNALFDACIARSVTAATEASRIPHPLGWRAHLPARLRPGSPAPATIGKEVGALTAWLQRTRPGWTFELTDEARDACGCNDRKGPAASATPRKGLYPFEVVAKFASESQEGSPASKCVEAAISVGASTGMPISLVAGLRTSESHLRTDPVTAKPVLCLGVKPKAKGRKIHRRRLTHGTHRTYWIAVSSPLVETVLCQWILDAKASNRTLLFPRFDGEGNPTNRPVSLSTLREGVRQIREDAQWHDLRRGVERALEVVHLVRKARFGVKHPSMLKKPVPMHVRNWITMRSNKGELGSRADYVCPVVDTMLDATRWLHLVEPRTLGGLVLGPELQGQDGDDDSSDASGETPSSVSCASKGSERSPSVRSQARSVDCYNKEQCGTHISRHRRGTLCSHPMCDKGICTKCHPDLRLSFRCSEHRDYVAEDSHRTTDANTPLDGEADARDSIPPLPPGVTLAQRPEEEEDHDRIVNEGSARGRKKSKKK